MVEVFVRDPANPLLRRNDWPYAVNTVFNPGATLAYGETVLLCRVEDRRGISHLTVARSTDGRTGWRIDPEPLIDADPDDRASAWGVEDPRITRVDELDGWVVVYTAYGPDGPSVALARTTDFKAVEPLGGAMPRDNKNGCLLPRRVGGRFVLYHRPASASAGRADVWLSRSADLRFWSEPEPALAARQGPWWDAVRVGMGPPPVETPHGWLGVYHGVRETANAPVYRVGLVLFDLEDPARVLRRSAEWVFSPLETYEITGDAGNVVFPTGLIHDPVSDELRLYYGAADSTIALATAGMRDVLDAVMSPD